VGECSFCYWLTQVVADEGPLNSCLCVSVCLTEFVMSCVVCLAGVLEWSREYMERSMEADSDPTDIYSRVSIHFLACCTTSQTGGRCLCVFLAQPSNLFLPDYLSSCTVSRSMFRVYHNSYLFACC